MARIPNALQLAEQFVSEVIQEEVLTQFHLARGGLEQFYRISSYARELALQGSCDDNFDKVQFDPLITELERALLIITADRFREGYQQYAKPVAFRLPPHLYLIEPVARAELTLRNLTIASLKSGRGRFRKPYWHPQWICEIERAEVEWQDAMLAWHPLKQSLF